MLKISVDRDVLIQNLADGGARPPIVIETDGNASCVYAREVVIPGPSRVVYRPKEHDVGDKTASVWIEVAGDIEVC